MKDSRSAWYALYRVCFVLSLSALFSVFAQETAWPEPVQLHIQVALAPAQHRLKAHVTVDLPENSAQELRFLLHDGLDPIVLTPGARLSQETTHPESSWLRSYRLWLPAGVRTVTLQYEGTIHHALDSADKELSHGIRDTPGIISDKGIYLGSGAGWYPQFDLGFLTFFLNVELPADWDAVSQGKRTRHEVSNNCRIVAWECSNPQEEIYLVAGRFAEYIQQEGELAFMVFLRDPDEHLAVQYLEATKRYVPFYERLIGKYPYTKFAAVENFWESGFGMPSFTLLGPKVMRFPFILFTSYPHEILHNWWGNSVYPDYAKGNWCEGLTAYLSDHLFKEMSGKAADYRRDLLRKYADYVSEDRDFSLRRFRSRHDAASAAVGYGKALMFFHMLRLKLGDETFKRGLQDFYRENRFKLAAYDDLRKSFERVSNKPLGEFFDQWIDRAGAPSLAVTGIRSASLDAEYAVEGILKQTQPGQVYHLSVPVIVTMEGQPQAWETAVEMTEKTQHFQLRVPRRPIRIDIDPRFDLFRRLDRDEVAPSLSEVFGAKRILIILPGSAKGAMQEAYRTLAANLNAATSGRAEIVTDDQVSELQPDASVVVLGLSNRLREKMERAVSPFGATLKEKTIQLGNRDVSLKGHSFVMVARARNPAYHGQSLVWITLASPEAAAGLGRKLPHYHGYSYLVFRGPEPTNVMKGRWPVMNSPMTVFLGSKEGSSASLKMGRLPVRPPLAVLDE